MRSSVRSIRSSPQQIWTSCSWSIWGRKASNTILPTLIGRRIPPCRRPRIVFFPIRTTTTPPSSPLAGEISWQFEIRTQTAVNLEKSLELFTKILMLIPIYSKSRSTPHINRNSSPIFFLNLH